jgi:spore germination protein YaaH
VSLSHTEFVIQCTPRSGYGLLVPVHLNRIIYNIILCFSAQENKKSTKDGHDASSTDSKSTTETVLSIGDSSSSPPHSDIDFHTSKLPQNKTDTTTTTNSTTESGSASSESVTRPTSAPVSSWADLFRTSSSKQPGNKVESAAGVAQKEPVKENSVKKVDEPVPTVIAIAEDKRAIRIAGTEYSDHSKKQECLYC